MAIADLPPMVYAVPGNHDLPYHSFKELKRSAFGVLVEAQRISLLTPDKPLVHDTIRLHGFPHGFEVRPPADKGLCLDIAVIHDYIWRDACRHAPEDKQLSVWRERLKGYDIAVFGDNHQGFLAENTKRCSVISCGTMLRRKSDERCYKPAVWIIYDNGEVEPHYLDTNRDQFTELTDVQREAEAAGIDAERFLDELGRLGDAAIDYREAVLHTMESLGTGPAVRKLVLEAMEGKS